MSDNISNGSNGPRLLVERKYDGQKGEHWVKWIAEFLDAAQGKGDEDASWAQTFLGTDQQVGLSPAQVRRRRVRLRECFSGHSP